MRHHHDNDREIVACYGDSTQFVQDDLSAAAGIIPHMNHTDLISEKLGIRPAQIAATIELLESGNTIPFIARYRKEATGGLDEDQLRRINAAIGKLRALDERRNTVMASIDEQGKLTTELQQQILVVETLTELEDIYTPYKPKRHTRASSAREKGLRGLADLILQQPLDRTPLSEIVIPFLNDQVPTQEDALAGARDIVAESISDHVEVRRVTREKAMLWGTLRSEKIDEVVDEKHVYATYYQFEYSVSRLRPHQVLAINRGEVENIIRVRVEIPERDWRNAITSVFCPDRRSLFSEQLDLASIDSAERLLLPAIERDVRRELTERAETHAISVFAANLKALLSIPPLAGQTVLGIDPGFRTGCKIAVVDPTGKLLETATIYPHEPQKERDRSLKVMAALVIKHQVTLISIGNGTASRETEQLAADVLKEYPRLKYIIVNEAGASVYSASPLARAEMPDLDVSLRGAVSIARRVQDPLAELVKIDPKSIGVGLYQHDVDQKQLNAQLDDVIESVVNAVGVDVNTASPALLTHIAGIGPKLADRIVSYREQSGSFTNRVTLRKIPGMGPKSFEQAAGFLRIRGGDNPLDASAIHPESYPIAEAVLHRAGLSSKASLKVRQPQLDALRVQVPLEKLAAEFNCGVPTLEDIFEQLVRPGRDPRADATSPILRSDVLKMEDLVNGMKLKGTVRNVVDFGAFVDIGVKQDGLLHRTQIPSDVHLQVGDVIQVSIQNVDIERGRIGLGWVTEK